MLPLIWKTVLATVQFNVQFRLLAKEIQIVSAERMLAAKFVAGETPVAQPAPDKFFHPRFLFAKLAGALDVGHDANLENDGKTEKLVFVARPHPDLLPRGEGTAIARSLVLRISVRQTRSRDYLDKINLDYWEMKFQRRKQINPNCFMTSKKRQMERLASSFNILFFLFVSLGSAALFCAVLSASHFRVWGFSEEELASINKLPVSVVFGAVGLGSFCLFFPFFLALYFSRYLLDEISRLEAQIASLSQKRDSSRD